VLDDAKRLDKEQMRWASALADLLRAGVAALDGRAAEAEALLERAIVALEALDMHLYAKAARRARGERGGVEEWMAKQSMRNPQAMVRLLVPGFPAR
jgi:eukaryotic-like serine/threonine-protein kinase